MAKQTMAKKKKIRVPLRKNRQNTPRQRGRFAQQVDDDPDLDNLRQDERISRKGAVTRHRTILSSAEGAAGQAPLRDVDPAACLPGRVISPRGGEYLVEAEDGRLFECSVRRLLQSLASQDRTAVAAGDRVLFRPAGGAPGGVPTGAMQGVIERIEPREGVLTRKIRGQKHVLVSNVDQVLIVASA